MFGIGRAQRLDDGFRYLLTASMKERMQKIHLTSDTRVPSYGVPVLGTDLPACGWIGSPSAEHTPFCTPGPGVVLTQGALGGPFLGTHSVGEPRWFPPRAAAKQGRALPCSLQSWVAFKGRLCWEHWADCRASCGITPGTLLGFYSCVWRFICSGGTRGDESKPDFFQVLARI